MNIYTVETPTGASVEVEAESNEEAEEKARAQVAPGVPAPQAPSYTPLTDQDGHQVRLMLSPEMNEEDKEWIFGGGGATQPMNRAGALMAGQEDEVLIDAGKSIPHYGKTFVSSLFGMPGDIIKAGRWLGARVAGETDEEYAKRFPSTSKPVGSAEIGEAIESVTGPMHKPEHRLGKTIDLGAAILPAAFGGPGSLATRIGTRVVAPAAAAGVAGELTEGTKFEPWAELAALAIAPIAVSKGIEPIVQGFMRKNAVLNTSQIRSLEKAEYKIANMAQHEIVFPAFEQWFTQQITKYSLDNPQMKATSKAAATVRELMADAIASGQPITLKHLQEWRRLLGKQFGKGGGIYGTNEADPFGVAGRMYGDINQFIRSLRPGVDIIGPDADIAVQAMRNADALHVRYKNSKLLDSIYKIARTRMGRGYSRAGSETEGLQQKFEQLAVRIAKPNAREARFFTPEMRDAIQRVAEGNVTLRALRALGSFTPVGLKGWSAFGATSAAVIAFDAFSSFIGTIAAAALPVAAIGAKAGAAVMTRRAADRAADLIRTGGKLPPAVPGVSPGVPAFGIPQVLEDEEDGSGP